MEWGDRTTMTQPHGRKKGTKATKTMLLRHHGWTIEYDGSSWPSDSFILRKKGSRSFAYCGSLDIALRKLFDSMIGESASHRDDYGKEIQDLANLIADVKNEFTAILALSDAENCIEKYKDQNKGDAIQ